MEEHPATYPTSSPQNCQGHQGQAESGKPPQPEEPAKAWQLKEMRFLGWEPGMKERSVGKK